MLRMHWLLPCADRLRDHSPTADDGSLTNERMNQQKKRGRPAKAKAEVQPVEDVEQVDTMQDVELIDIIEDVEQPTQDETQGNPELELVRRVEMEIGRTHNAWGMVDPVELIDAVKRVIQGGAK
jgi:hypothetical protein